MGTYKIDRFLKEVLIYVKFPFDRDDIESELKCHMMDKLDYYIEQGYDQATAEKLCVVDMGDARKIGVELNKQHNPIIGWLWKVTNVVVILLVILNVYINFFPIVISLFNRNPDYDIPKTSIVYKINVNKKVQIDDTVIHFTDIIYEKNGNMNILYQYYDTRLWGTGWSLGDIGKITDNLGNTYYEGGFGGSGGFISKYIRTVKNFSIEADTLFISYDNFNRKYKVEIPLQTGDSNEQK